jgi:hypothetical protein
MTEILKCLEYAEIHNLQHELIHVLLMYNRQYRNLRHAWLCQSKGKAWLKLQLCSEITATVITKHNQCTKKKKRPKFAATGKFGFNTFRDVLK